jgi:hypothetical protein
VAELNALSSAGVQHEIVLWRGASTLGNGSVGRGTCAIVVADSVIGVDCGTPERVGSQVELLSLEDVMRWHRWDGDKCRAWVRGTAQGFSAMRRCCGVTRGSKRGGQQVRSSLAGEIPLGALRRVCDGGVTQSCPVVCGF